MLVRELIAYIKSPQFIFPNNATPRFIISKDQGNKEIDFLNAKVKDFTFKDNIINILI